MPSEYCPYINFFYKKVLFSLFLATFRERTIISAKKDSVLLCFILRASRIIALAIEHLQHLFASGKKKKDKNTDPFFSI